MENSVFKRHLMRKLIVSGAFALLTIGGCIGINAVNEYIKPFEGFITTALTKVESDNETNSLGNRLAVEIEQEGIVLAKNDNDVLPLSKNNKKVNVFGHSVIDWLISNSGSGSSGPGSSQKSVGLLEALDLYGVEYNTALIDYYKSWAAPRSLPFSISSGYNSLYRLTNPSLSNDASYKTLYDEVLTETDTAIVVISRAAGEHIDPPHEQINNHKSQKATNPDRGYLELTEEEEELLVAVGQDYDKVIVLINTTNVIQCDFLFDIEGLDSCLIVGATGTVGAKAIPQVMWGDIDPSGRTADTWPMKHEYNPTYFTSGYWPNKTGNWYTGNPSGSNLASQNQQAGVSFPNANFADYIEGIYVGYRWFETADAEGFWDASQYGGYENVVAFPFGHGLSYTDFKWEFMGSNPIKNAVITENQDITLQVKVTNTGSRQGRDVVEVYLTAPYYAGEIEKSSVKLVGFQKTKTLLPGESETVEIVIHTRDFLSFDGYDSNYNGHAGWELDEGNYEVKFMKSAHTMKEDMANNPIVFRVPNTIDVDEDTHTGEPSAPLFTGDDAVDGISVDGKSIDEPIDYITRADFAPLLTNLIPTRPWNAALNTSQGKTGAKVPNAYSTAQANEWDNATGYDAFGKEIPNTNPTFGQENNLRVLDENDQLTELGRLLAQDYNAPEWEDLLDQVRWAESIAIVQNSSSYNRPGIASVGLREGKNNDFQDCEAASQVGVDLDGGIRLTAYPTPTVQAQCWNVDMPYLFGLSEARDMNIGGKDGAMGPASNIHRSPYGGRNSEYHSEDGFLAGRTLAAVTRGMADGGKAGFIKHFAVNDTEYHRVGLYTWLTEQALREVYLRPFEEAVKRGEAQGLMTAFNRVGATWTGGSEALVQGVLRNEWGFKGMIITDMIENSNLMDINQHFRAGANYVLGGSGWNTGVGGTPNQNTASPRLQHRVRENAKQVIYGHIRLFYMNYLFNTGEGDSPIRIISAKTKAPWVWWKPALGSVEALAIVGLVFGIIAPLLPSNPEFRSELVGRIFKSKGKKEQ
ncbi:MAG: hypothetical protein GXY27_02370 [Erysipelotrichaceae bacterium]|jgi:beta-glucosidase|nr:hypothetical protein [Erysipelotrichaceae bacterium]